jgi:hypothetical protein
MLKNWLRITYFRWHYIRNVIKIILLILVPWIFIVFAAPLYNKPHPELGGWPFLWWYLFAWVFIQPVIINNKPRPLGLG